MYVLMWCQFWQLQLLFQFLFTIVYLMGGSGL